MAVFVASIAFAEPNHLTTQGATAPRAFPSCTLEERPGADVVDTPWTIRPILVALNKTLRELQARQGTVTQAQAEAALEAVSLSATLRQELDESDPVRRLRRLTLADSERSFAEVLEIAESFGYRGPVPPLLRPKELERTTDRKPANDFLTAATTALADLQSIRDTLRTLPAIAALERDLLRDRDVQQEARAIEKEQLTIDEELRRIGEQVDALREAAARKRFGKNFVPENIFDRQVLEDVRESEEFKRLPDTLPLRTQQNQNERALAVLRFSSYEALENAFQRRRGDRGTALQQALRRYTVRHPEARRAFTSLAALEGATQRFSDRVTELSDVMNEPADAVATRNAEDNQRRWTASYFGPGTTMDLALVTGLERTADGTFFVASLSPMVGKAKTPGLGVKLAFVAIDSEDSAPSQRRAIAAAAGRWLEQPRIDGAAKLHCKEPTR